MMNELLKLIRTLPLTHEMVNAFLYGAAGFAVVGDITVDDWGYLARLMLFRIHKQRRPT